MKMRGLTLLAGAAVAGVVLLPGASTASPAAAHPALWVITNLGMLSGQTSVAVDVNDRGQIIGTAGSSASGEDADARAFVWQNRKMIGLQTLGGPVVAQSPGGYVP